MKWIARLLVVMLLLNCILVIIPGSSATFYIYENLEDGVLPFFDFIASRGTVSMDMNSSINGVNCINFTSFAAGAAFNAGNDFDNLMMPDAFHFKFMLKHISNQDIAFSMQGESNGNLLQLQLMNTSGNNGKIRITSFTSFYTFDMTWERDMIYTVDISNINWLSASASTANTFDVTISNATSSESKTGLKMNSYPFIYGTVEPFYGVGYSGGTAFQKSILFVDDWTLGTRIVLTTDDATSTQSTYTTVNGEIVNDGSTLQDGSQDNLSCKFVYDVVSSPVNWTVGNVVRPDSVHVAGILSGFPYTDANKYMNIYDIVFDGDSSYVYNDGYGWKSETYTVYSNTLKDIDLAVGINVTVVAKVNNSLNDDSYVNVILQNITDDSRFFDTFTNQYVVNDENWHYINFSTTVKKNGDPFTKTDLDNCFISLFIWNNDTLYNTSVSQVYIKIFDHYNYSYEFFTNGEHTGDDVNDVVDGLTPGQVYFYRLYGETNYTNSSSFDYGDEKYFLCRPEVPTDVGQTVVNDSAINISWTKGTGANTTIIVKKTTGIPSSVTDGTIIYNSTGSYHVIDGISNGDIAYYRMWSYANWSSPDLYQFSSNYTDVSWGALILNCYDETNHSNLTFDVFVSSPDGSEVYENFNCVNYHSVNVSLCPHGEDINILVSNSSHEDRLYTVDLYENAWYFLDTYLPLSLPSGGEDDPDYDPENESYSYLYRLTVVDESEQTIEGVTMDIKRYINETGVYEDVTTADTDGNGNFDVWLIAGAFYKVTLSKDGLERKTANFRPSDLIFTRTFKMYYIPPEYSNETSFGNAVTFNGYVNNSGIVFVNYSDNTLGTISARICVYVSTSSNYDQGFLIACKTFTGNNDFQFNTSIYGVQGLSSEDCFEVLLYLEHEIFGNVTDQFITCGEDKPYRDLTNKTRFDNLFELNYGSNPFGWSNVFGFILLCACMFSFGERNSGVSLMLCGGLLLFVNSIIGITFVGTLIPSLFILLGILVQWHNHRKEALG